MLIGHSRPQDIAWSVSGAGAAILSPTEQLADGRPDTITALRWLSGTQNTASVLRLRGDWSAAFTPGIVGLSNISLPAGTRIGVAFRRASDPAGTYPYMPAMHNSSQRIVEGPRGERTAWLLPKVGAQPVVGIEIQIYNDVNGSPGIVASSQCWIGEAVVCPVIDFCPAARPSIEDIDPTTLKPSIPGIPFRRLNFAIRTDEQSRYFGDYARLIGKIDRGQSAVYVMRWQNPDGSLDADMLHATAMIGHVTKLPSKQHEARDIFSSGACVVDEDPIPT